MNEKKALKYLVQGPGVRKTFRLSSHTPGYSLKSCPGHIICVLYIFGHIYLLCLKNFYSVLKLFRNLELFKRHCRKIETNLVNCNIFYPCFVVNPLIWPALMTGFFPNFHGQVVMVPEPHYSECEEKRVLVTAWVSQSWYNCLVQYFTIFFLFLNTYFFNCFVDSQKFLEKKNIHSVHWSKILFKSFGTIKVVAVLLTTIL